MKLNKMTKEELELLPYTKIAKMYLEENKTTMNTLWKSVNASRTNEILEGCKLLIASQLWTRNLYYTLHSITFQQPKSFALLNKNL